MCRLTDDRGAQRPVGTSPTLLPQAAQKSQACCLQDFRLACGDQEHKPGVRRAQASAGERGGKV